MQTAQPMPCSSHWVWSVGGPRFHEAVMVATVPDALAAAVAGHELQHLRVARREIIDCWTSAIGAEVVADPRQRGQGPDVRFRDRRLGRTTRRLARVQQRCGSSRQQERDAANQTSEHVAILADPRRPIATAGLSVLTG